MSEKTLDKDGLGGTAQEEQPFSLSQFVYFVSVSGFSASIFYVYGCSIGLGINLIPYFTLWDHFNQAISWGVRFIPFSACLFGCSLMMTNWMIEKESLKNKPRWFEFARALVGFFFLLLASFSLGTVTSDPNAIANALTFDLITNVLVQIQIAVMAFWLFAALFIWQHTTIKPMFGNSLKRYLTFMICVMTSGYMGYFGYRYMQALLYNTNLSYTVVIGSEGKDTLHAKPILVLDKVMVIADQNRQVIILPSSEIKSVRVKTK